MKAAKAWMSCTWAFLALCFTLPVLHGFPIKDPESCQRIKEQHELSSSLLQSSSATRRAVLGDGDHGAIASQSTWRKSWGAQAITAVRALLAGLDTDLSGSLHGKHPISTALRCVVLLTILFFSVYLLATFLRLGWTVVGLMVKRPQSNFPDNMEKAVAQASDALALVPMLCVLMISIRLRAMQLGLPNGDPPAWIQLSMYTHTAAFFVRFFLGLLTSDPEKVGSDNILYNLGRGIYFMTSCILYTSAAVIAASIVVLEAVVTTPTRTSTLSMTMFCATMLAVAYILECLILEGLQAMGTSALRDYPTELGTGSTLLQFPLMFCVLLVGMSLRSVQLHLQPAVWALTAMYVSTLAIILRGASGLLVFAVRWLLFALGVDYDSWSQMRRLRAVLWSCWLILSAATYLGTGVVVASIFVMEPRPIDSILPDPSIGHASLSGVPPVSTAMRCVMFLTVLFFGVHLCLKIGRTAGGAVGVLAEAATDAVHRALAFTPMLCIMMISLRLRAMQLRMRDPQEWARNAMCLVVVAITVQVVCSLFPLNCKSETLTGKLLVVLGLSLRYLATGVLYLATATLLLALLLMAPAE